MLDTQFADAKLCPVVKQNNDEGKAMSHTKYSHLTDDEFLRVVQTEPTIDDVDVEVRARYGRLLSDLDTLRDIESNCEELGIDVSSVCELLGVADKHHCASPSELREKLERADKFYDLADEAGDTFKKLADLAATTA